MAKAKRTPMTPIRLQKIKSNATVGTAERKIEEECGLPEGSVCLFRPYDKRANRNKTIRALRAEWAREYA